MNKELSEYDGAAAALIDIYDALELFGKSLQGEHIKPTDVFPNAANIPTIAPADFPQAKRAYYLGLIREYRKIAIRYMHDFEYFTKMLKDETKHAPYLGGTLSDLEHCIELKKRGEAFDHTPDEHRQELRLLAHRRKRELLAENVSGRVVNTLVRLELQKNPKFAELVDSFTKNNWKNFMQLSKK